jgi:hypothetical protein
MPEHSSGAAKNPRQRVLRDVIEATPNHHENFADDISASLFISAAPRISRDCGRVLCVERLEPSSSIS